MNVGYFLQKIAHLKVLILERQHCYNLRWDGLKNEFIYLFYKNKKQTFVKNNIYYYQHAQVLCHKTALPDW